MVQYENFMIGFLEDYIHINEFIKRDKTFETQTSFKLCPNIDISNLGQRLKYVDLIMTSSDEDSE